MCLLVVMVLFCSKSVSPAMIIISLLDDSQWWYPIQFSSSSVLLVFLQGLWVLSHIAFFLCFKLLEALKYPLTYLRTNLPSPNFKEISFLELTLSDPEPFWKKKNLLFHQHWDLTFLQLSYHSLHLFLYDYYLSQLLIIWKVDCCTLNHPVILCCGPSPIVESF